MASFDERLVPGELWELLQRVAPPAPAGRRAADGAGRRAGRDRVRGDHRLHLVAAPADLRWSALRPSSRRNRSPASENAPGVCRARTPRVPTRSAPTASASTLHARSAGGACSARPAERSPLCLPASLRRIGRQTIRRAWNWLRPKGSTGPLLPGAAGAAADRTGRPDNGARTGTPRPLRGVPVGDPLRQADRHSRLPGHAGRCDGGSAGAFGIGRAGENKTGDGEAVSRPLCLVPPAGFEPAHTAPEGASRITGHRASDLRWDAPSRPSCARPFRACSATSTGRLGA